MLSALQVAQFQAFGFIVLEQALSKNEVHHLQETHDRVIVDAPIYNYFGTKGTRMLNPFVQADECFATLNIASWKPCGISGTRSASTLPAATFGPTGTTFPGIRTVRPDGAG